MAHHGQRHTGGSGETQALKNDLGPTFVNANLRRNKREGEVDDLDQRLDDVGDAEVRYKAEQLKRNVNLHHAGHVRSHVKADHREESRGPALVETIDRQLDAIDLMAPFAQEIWPKTAARQTVDDVCQQRDPPPGRQRGRDQSGKSDCGNQD